MATTTNPSPVSPGAPATGTATHGDPNPTGDDTPFTRTARWAGVDEPTIARAANSTRPRLLVSGRLASGKDTVAEAVMAALGEHDAVRISFATALKHEVDTMLDIVRSAHTRNQAVDSCISWAGIDDDKVRQTIDLLTAAVEADIGVHAYARTTEIRHALQLWGTDVRRRCDYDYWVKQALKEAVTHIAAGHAVYITDGRFRNEVAAADALGFAVIRLEVALAIRARRLYERDGLAIDPVAETHPSEQDLETYEGFDMWVDNSGTLEETIEPVVSFLRASTR